MCLVKYSEKNVICYLLVYINFKFNDRSEVWLTNSIVFNGHIYYYLYIFSDKELQQGGTVV